MEGGLGEAEGTCCVWTDSGGVKPSLSGHREECLLWRRGECWGQPTRPVFTEPWSQGQPVLFLDKSSYCSLSFSTCSFLFGPKWKALRHSLPLFVIVSLSLCVRAKTSFQKGVPAGWCTWFLQICSRLKLMYYPQTMSQANQAELWDAGVGSGGPSLHDAPGQTSTSPFFFFFCGRSCCPSPNATLGVCPYSPYVEQHQGVGVGLQTKLT